ncbi:hypothetical protein QOZ80_1AG0008740 [Eleusine coracana subsp. coracana]|nr:hypothetical protein QOZ80_1AG0008740 [Eleusine coracana subsp. coracana]
MAGRLHKPKAKSFWILVRRLLLRKNRKQHPAHPAAEEEKSGLLSRGSLEELLLTDGAPEDAAKKHGQAPVEATGGWAGLHLHRPVMARSQAACGGRDGAAMHRRFMFGSFRRRLLMRRPWRPVLVAIPE